MLRSFFPLLILSVLLAALAGCQTRLPDKLVLVASDFNALKGWNQDRQGQAVLAFLNSCKRIERLPDSSYLHNSKANGRAGEWKPLCRMAATINPYDDIEARQFFEQYFRPFKVLNRSKEEGLFTGYYEIDLKGSKRKNAAYTYPLYKLPADLKHIAPYYTRQEIDSGALARKGLELVYVNDPVEAFFLHIQGSGRVYLEDGTMIPVRYHGQNGHPYFAIGKYLVEQEGLDKATLSADRIKQWLYENPYKAKSVMNMNPSYVFFRIGNEEGPVGGEGVPLTPERSLAVDKRFIPYGVPLWLETTTPATPRFQETLFHQLMIAQDTGGAIKGPVRGDVFFGNGKRASELASYMKQPGQYYMLLPRR